MDDETIIVSSDAVAATMILIKKMIKNSKTKIIRIMLNGFVPRISGVIRKRIKAIIPKTPNPNEI